jgi:signal transduction histidine kinase
MTRTGSQGGGAVPTSGVGADAVSGRDAGRWGRLLAAVGLRSFSSVAVGAIGPDTLKERVEEFYGPLMRSRARLAIVIFASAYACYVAVDLLAGMAMSHPVQLVRCANVLLVAAAWTMLGTRADYRRSCRVAMIVVTATIASLAPISILQRDAFNPVIGLLAMTILTANFFPWHAHNQALVSLSSAAALVATFAGLGMPPSGVTLAMLMTSLLTFAITVLITRSLDVGRYRGMVDDLRRRTAEQRLAEANNELEERVEQRTADLQHAIEELRQFTYSVSHDLRSPLRTIEGMTAMVQERYGDTLDQESADNLERVRRAALRMEKLIDGLLARSRAGQTEIRPHRVDLVPLADDVMHELRASDKAREVIWSRPDSLPVVADRMLATIVLQQLLDNAWKFTRDCRDARIELGLAPHDDEVEYFVRDNGVGFEMREAGKLFENFRRLHGDEYAGTGIGLATVRTIAQRHGGSIRIESAPGQGTTVYFRLGEP